MNTRYEAHTLIEKIQPLLQGTRKQQRQAQELVVAAWALEILSKQFNCEELHILATDNRSNAELIAKSLGCDLDKLKSKTLGDILWKTTTTPIVSDITGSLESVPFTFTKSFLDRIRKALTKAKELQKRNCI